MVREFNGTSIVFRLVRLEDAAEIVRLRTDPRGAHFLSETSRHVTAQRQWIEAYLERERSGRELYYMICRPGGRAAGTLRLYDFCGPSFRWGSWVIEARAPWHFAIESFFFVHELGFTLMGFQEVRMETRLDNQPIIKFLQRMGAGIVGQDAEEYHFLLRRETYEGYRDRYARFLPQGLAAKADLRHFDVLRA
ncbi:MAG: GNAT family N-acetyltransferase [Verrucomicrobiales bacterium]